MAEEEKDRVKEEKERQQEILDKLNKDTTDAETLDPEKAKKSESDD